jgi:hypothetical protein
MLSRDGTVELVELACAPERGTHVISRASKNEVLATANRFCTEKFPRAKVLPQLYASLAG